MLQLVLGRSGFGKTEYVRQNLVERAQRGEEGLLLLVPDQFSFDSERAVLKRAGPSAAARIQVLTFSRMAEEVFRLYGGITENRVDDSGRILLMSMAVDACQDQLQLYSEAAKSDRIGGLMLAAVDEFKAAGILPDDLFAACGGLSGALGQKTHEIALVYSAFEALLKDRYIEPADLLTRLAQLLESHDYFAGKTLFIDGFEGFGGQKLRVLAAALRGCGQVVCTLCCDTLYGDETEFFAPIEKTGRSLVALAKENGVPVAAPLVLRQAHRFKSPELAVLEARLFRGEATAPQAFGGAITLYEARDVYAEAEYVAATIRRLVMEGRRYGEMTVVCRNARKYRSIMESAFEKWEIPAFVARPRQVDSAPLMRLVLSAFRVLEYGFRTEDVLTLLKTGLCGLSVRQLSALENYLFLWRLTGSDWKSPFYRSPGGFGDPVDPRELAVLEEMRARVVEPLLKFGQATAQNTGAEISAAVYVLLQALGSDKALLENAALLKEKGQQALAADQLRLWKDLMAVLDRFARILDSQKVSRTRYWRLLREVLAKEELMDIPLHMDTVLFGSADQVKQENPQITFLVGAVQGEFPLTPVVGGIFSDSERRALTAQNLPLEGGVEESALLERFYTYAAACAACEKLYISYHLSAGSDDFSPGELVGRVEDLFVGIRVQRDKPAEYFASSKEAVFSASAASFGQNTPQAQSYRAAFDGDSRYMGRLEALGRMAEKREFHIADPALARQMFSAHSFSPSQIDTYFRCGFQYFCKYGLGAKERKPAEINVLEYGTLMHYLFERIFSGEFLRYRDRTLLEEEIRSLITAYADQRMGGYNQMSARDKYRFSRMADTAVLLILWMIEEILQSRFAPAYLELLLAPGGQFPPLRVKTPEGEEVLVGGVIDRVDIYDAPDGKYVRVVDYKTGHKELNLADMLSGINLQMLIYLAALSQQGYRSAGALYMPAAFPALSAEKGVSPEKLLAERDKKLCMNGLVLDDPQVITAMEAEGAGKYIPVGLKPDGSITKPESALSRQELEQVFGHVQHCVSAMFTALTSGHIGAKPLTVNTNACAWCPFTAVCMQATDEKTDLKLSKEEAARRMKGGDADGQ